MEKKKRFTKNCYNCLQHERLLKIFYFHTLNSQTWLNILMDDCHLSNIQKLEKKFWCYSFNLSTSCKRRRLQYTYFGTVQTLIKLIWDGPTKGKYLNFGVPSQKGGKKPFGVPRPHYKLIRVTLYYVI